jgi:hypothetical protein
MRIGITLTVVSVMALCANAARSDSEKCSEAREEYQTAVGDVSSYLRSYTRCISESKGHDDCSIEFSRLQDAQTDCESAVASYKDDCARK